MPDQENYINRRGVALNLPKTPVVDQSSLSGGSNTGDALPGKDVSVNDLWMSGLSKVKPVGAADIPMSSVYTGDRYTETRPGTDYEEMHAQQQSSFDKWRNSIGKMVGVAGTSFAAGTVGLVYGIGAMVKDQRLASLIDNDVTRGADDIMKKFEDYAPNYYTHSEQDAEWQSPKNILTANFWSDKVLKNLGYSIGAIGGGIVWAKTLAKIGLTGALVRAGQGMEAANAVESAMVAVPKLQKYAAFENALNSIATKYIKNPISSVLKDSDRILTSTMGTFGEASMEGLQNMNDFRTKAIQDYKDEHGLSPIGKDLDEINMYADKVGMYTWGMNSLLLTGTNYIQLPKILSSSRKADKLLINDIDQATLGGDFSKMVPATRFGTILERTKSVGNLLFSPSEAFEEGAQYAIQTGVSDYFKRAKDNKENVNSFLSNLNGSMSNVFGEGVNKTLSSKEGLESILIGGISGGMQQIRGTVREQGLFGTGGVKRTNTEIALSALNKTNIEKTLKDSANFLGIGIGSQQLRQQAIRNNDKLSEKDYEQDFVLSYIMPRVKYGKKDSVTQELSYYESQAMTDEGFQQLVTSGIANQKETRADFINRISNLKESANNVDNLYSVLNDKYGNKPDDEGKQLYSDGVIDKMVYAASKIADYDMRIPGINNSLAEQGINVEDILQSIIKNNKPNKEATVVALNEINSLNTTTDVKDQLKSDLTDIVELSLRRKLFIDEYDDIKFNPSRYESASEFKFGETRELPVKVTQVERDVATNKKVEVEKKLQVGKAYSLNTPLYKKNNALSLAPKITILSQTLGGELEVMLPNGEKTFITPEEFKKYNVSEQENASQEIADILDKAIDTVLEKDKYEEVKKELAGQKDTTKLNFINSQDNQSLIDDIQKEFDDNVKLAFEKREAQKKKEALVAKQKERIAKEQKEIELKSGQVGTGNPNTETWDKEEGKLKSADTLYTSSITESEGYNNATLSAPHIQRSRQFLNNVKRFKNRNKIKAILVTLNQEKSLGLEGITQLSYPGVSTADAVNNDEGVILQVFILQENGKDYFVDQHGIKLTEVGQPMDLSKVVFQTMPTTKLEYKSGGKRYRANQATEAAAKSKAWAEKRKQLFDAPEGTYTVYNFRVSRGIAKKNTVGGISERNNVGTVLIDQDAKKANRIIANQEGLIIIPTNGTVAHNGELLNAPNGRPMIQFGDTLEYLSNKTFNPAEAKSIFEVMNFLAKDIVGQAVAGKVITINRAYTSFLQNVMFYVKGAKTSGNQIFIDESNLYFAGKTFSLVDFASNEKEILEELSKTYNNVNKESLTTYFNEPFIEYYFENDKLNYREWSNYQSYLLSNRLPNGNSRSMDNTPLSTAIAEPTPALPYTHEQKYSTLEELELPVQFVAPQAPVVAQPIVPTATIEKIGEYEINGVTENKITLKDPIGEVTFTATIDNGKISVTSFSSERTTNMVNEGKVTPYIQALKDNNLFDASKSLEESLLQFISINISAKLEGMQKTEQPVVAAPVVVETPTEPVITPEAPIVPEETPEGFKDFKDVEGPSDDYRLMGKSEEAGMTDAELQLFKEWHAANVPGIPYEVLENMIMAHDGEKAWGVFEQGVAKFVRGGLRGTEYHEIFEGIWKGFLTESQRDEIVNELRESGKDFTDRQSGKKLNYATATVNQIKERVADDFADYRLGKLPAKSLEEKIRRFFKLIMDFFKSFVNKPSLKEELFKAINTGEFKNKALPETVKNEAAEYRKAENLTEQQTHEFVQDMQARAYGIMYKEAKKLLFDPKKITGKEIFNKIEAIYAKEKVGKISKREYIGDVAWKQLVVKTKNAMRTLGINFNEEDRVNINDEDVNSRDYAAEPFSTNWKKNSPFAIKFTLATLIQRKATNQESESVLELPKADISSVGGYKLMNFTRAFATVLDKLANTTSITKAVDKLFDLAKYDANYVSLLQRVGNTTTTAIPFEKFENEDWKLFIQFIQTFTKQNPEALVQYKNAGEVYISPANLRTVIKNMQSTWLENIRVLSTSPDSFITYVSAKQAFVVNEKLLKEVNIKKHEHQVKFLQDLGIDFHMSDYIKLKDHQKNKFANAVSGIYTHLNKANNLATITGKTIGISGQLSIIAELLVKVNNPNQDSTYFGVDGKRRQSFSDNNTPSVFENEFNEANTLEELLIARPELNDIFSANSQVLKKGRLFFNEEGLRIKSMKLKYIQGTLDEDSAKGTITSKLSLGERFTQEINQNINGDYYVLIPADGSTEWMMNLGNAIRFTNWDRTMAYDKFYAIFKGYLKDDIALALDSKNRKKLKNVGDKAKELRFFKDILSEKTLEDINKLIEENATDTEFNEYIKNNSDSINSSLKEYLDATVTETRRILETNKQIIPSSTKGMFKYAGLNDVFTKKNNLNKYKLSEDGVNDLLTFANMNYIINNIEYHKLLFGDPFQFKITDKDGKVILDETKRIKSFLSPRRTTFDTPEYNTFLNNNYNIIEEGIELEPKDPGYNRFESHVNTVTVKDVMLVGSLVNVMKVYGDVNEADGFSWLSPEKYREIKLKNSQWSDEAEAFHKWQMANARNKLAAKGDYVYKNKDLQKSDIKTISKPSPKYKLEVLKPIVSGVKNNVSTINLVLDKFSQMPIYYGMIEGTNMEKLYVKMVNENIGYVIVQSGRKAGAEELHNLYNSDGSFNAEVFDEGTIVKVPWKAYGIQVENSYQDNKSQTRGSQITKVSSLDLFENGQPIGKDEERQEVIKKEYDRNKDLLDRMHENAYKELLNKLGVVDLGTSFMLPDGKSVSETLMHEMLRREVSDNTLDTIQLDDNNQFRIPFEASPSYMQIRSILYSLIDASLGRPKVSGGAHVQVAVTMFENATKGRSLVRKINDVWTKVSKSEYAKLSEEEKKGVVLTDDTLKFYTEKDPYCEIMLPSWFKEKLNKGKYKTDEDILNYLNTTKEGQSILRGVGFRIPTQSPSSIEVFRVKGFLPDFMGSTVVVPSEITVKAGSDFDIDKLNMYLKSIYIDVNGDIRLVTLKGTEQETKDFYADVYEKTIQKKIDKIEKFDEFRNKLLEVITKIESSEDEEVDVESLLTDEEYDFYQYHVDIFSQIEEHSAEKNMNASDYILSQIKDIDTAKEKLTSKMLSEQLKTDFVKDMYKRSLENEYYDSLEKLITLPENFKRLITPVDDAGLKDISDKLDVLRGYNESNIKNRLLDRNYMTSLRNAFVTAKRWVGIAAVNITGHSLSQKIVMYIDPEKLAKFPTKEAELFGNGKIALPHNKVMVDGKEYISVSGRLNADGKFISDGLSGYATSFVDVAKDPYILKIIGSDLAVGTFMFLQRAGVPIETSAIFMNQPIIKEYLNLLDSTNTRGLFNKKNINTIKMKFSSTNSLISSVGISIDTLDKNIEEYYSKGSLSEAKNAEQQNILAEFLKYAKMAEQLFQFNQATNYDTTRFSSGDTLFKKQTRTTQALETNIFSSVSDLLKNSSIGKQATLIDFSMEAMGTILRLEQDQFRVIIDSVLKPYSENYFLSNDDYERIANKIRASFFDFIIQTRGGLNKDIKNLLVDVETSVANRIEKAKITSPEAKILQHLERVSSGRMNGVQSIKLDVNVKEAYDENMYTGYMRELRDNPKTKDLFEDIVMLSLLQGTYQSAISIKNIIPIEDYASFVTPIINNIMATPEIALFSKGAFQRNNFKDDSIMPRMSPKFLTTTQAPIAIDIYGDDVFEYYSPTYGDYTVTAILETLGLQATDRKILFLGEKYNQQDIKYDFVKVPRMVEEKETGVRIDVLNGKAITSADFKAMKERGDLSLRDVFGYQKVRNIDGSPLVAHYDKEGNATYVYKLINLYGDGMYVSEYNINNTPSEVKNGTLKINEELEDVVIIEAVNGKFKKAEIIPAVATPIIATIEKESEVSTPIQPSTSVEKKELFTIEKAIAQKSFRGKSLVFVDGIASGKETVVAMSNNRTTGVITIDQKGMEQKFNDKAWTTPSKQLDGSFATALAENQFGTFNEWLTFALVHEVKHDTIFKQEGETTGQYEDRINEAALEDMKVNYNIASKDSTSEVTYKDKEKRIIIDYPSKISQGSLYNDLNSNELIQLSKIKYSNNIAEEIEIYQDYAEAITKKYGEPAGDYVGETQSEITVEEAEFLRDHPQFAKDFIEGFLNSELGDGKTMQDYAQNLLNKNERLIDTAQTSLFDPNNEDLEDADEPNPCGTI